MGRTERVVLLGLLVGLVSALHGVQLASSINNACNMAPFSDCGTWMERNISSSFRSAGLPTIRIGAALPGYKPFWGTGAALTESSAYLLHRYNSTNPQGFTSFARNLTKFSSMRVPVGTSDFALSEWTFVSNTPDWNMSSFQLQRDRFQRPMLNHLLSFRTSQQPLTLIFSVWSPPIWLKKGSEWSYANLLEQNTLFYRGVANYWLSFLSNLRSYIEPRWHSRVGKIYFAIQNEPFQSVGSDLPGCSMSSQDQIEIIKLVLSGVGAVRLGRLPEPRVLVLDHNWDLLSEAEEIALGVNATGVAFHAYGGSYVAQETFRDNFPASEIHLTEFSGSYTDDPNGTWDWDMTNIIFGSLNSFGQSVTYWNLVLDDNAGPLNPKTPGYCTTCNGMFRITKDYSQILAQPRFYTLGLLSCIPYGAVRVSIDFSRGLEETLTVMAFMSSKQTECCLVIQNKGTAIDFDVEVGNLFLRIHMAADTVNSLSIFM